MDLKNYEEAKKILSSSVESIAKDHTLMTRSLLNSASEFYKTMLNIKRMSEGKDPLFDKPTIEDLNTMGKPLEPQFPDVMPPKPFSFQTEEKEKPSVDLKQVYQNLVNLREGLQAVEKLLYDTQTLVYDEIKKQK